MEDLIQIIFFIVFGVVALLARVWARKKPQREPEIVFEEEEVTLPPWGNLPMEELPSPESVEPEPPIVQSPSPPPRETSVPTPTPTRAADSSRPKEPAIAGIPLSPQTFRQGIILAEILERPKSLRRSRQ